MAGRGARIHILPPSKIKGNAEFFEVDALCRIRKLFPDAKERQSEEQFRAEQISRNKAWLSERTQCELPNVPWASGTFRGSLDELGNRFEGEWENDVKHGYFSIRYASGERFEGHFEKGRRFGEGTSYYTDGSRFHGDYINDLRHGRGMFWSENDYYMLQKLWMRRYEFGRLVEEHEIYTDTQRDAEPQKLGFGTHIDALGRRYEGDFVEYEKHGKGRFTYPDGRVEVGEWVKGLRQGTGMLKLPVSSVRPLPSYYFQQYRNDELLSETESDQLNYDNFFWYDEGGFASHN